MGLIHSSSSEISVKQWKFEEISKLGSQLGSQLGSKLVSQLSLTILIIWKRIGVDYFIQFRDISETLEIW